FLCVCLTALSACGGRLPSSSRSTSLIRKHFNQYGREYKQSPFGGKKVANVEILQINEIHKKLVSVIAFVTLSGSEVFKVRVTLEKGPFGWRYASWENLSAVPESTLSSPEQ
ncbi:MAG: hypothetical protein U1D33_02140, partial [bacterium]|nr:hypothetical protein [bacterium]